MRTDIRFSPIVQFQEISMLPHRRDWNFLGVGVSGRPKNLKKYMELTGIFRGVGRC